MWEVMGMSGWDRDQWPKTALGRPKALAFPKDLACRGEGGLGPRKRCLETLIVFGFLASRRQGFWDTWRGSPTALDAFPQRTRSVL